MSCAVTFNFKGSILNPIGNLEYSETILSSVILCLMDKALEKGNLYGTYLPNILTLKETNGFLP